MSAHRFFQATIFLVIVALLGIPACSRSTATPAPTPPPVPTIQAKKLTDNHFNLTFENHSLQVVLDSPDAGILTDLAVSTVEITGGQLVLINDPAEKYLPEIRYFTSQTPTPLRILMRLSEYSPYSLHIEHDMNLNALIRDPKVGDSLLPDIKAALSPYFEEGVSGLIISDPESLNATTKVSIYESSLPGVFVVVPVSRTKFSSIENVLVISFLDFPDVALGEVIASEIQPVNLVNMVGLSLEDIANFQYLADHPELDPEALTPFGEKTVQEQFSEVQTRTIKNVIRIVEIIDQPCGAPEMEKKVFAMDPAPGTEITPIKDKVILYRCEEVSHEELKIIDLSFLPDSEMCTQPEVAVGVDVVEVIDTSGSMSDGGIEAAKSAAVEFTRRLDPLTDRIGLVEFNSGANVLSEVTDNFGNVSGLISGLEANGGTAIDTGLSAGFQVLQASGRAGVPKVLILLSDGGSDPASALAAAGYIKANGVNIITVGVGDADRSLLARIANTSQDFLFSGSQEGLTSKFDEAFQLSKRPIVAKDLTVRFTTNTGYYDLMENLLSGTAHQIAYGVVEWQLPSVMEGQIFEQQIVVRPLGSSEESYGQLEVSYDQCADGSIETLPAEDITQAETREVTSTREVLKKGKIKTGVLEEYQTQQYVIETGATGLFSVEIEGAGSQLPPEIVSGNGVDYLYPLYTTKKGEKNISLFLLKDPKLYWFYLQSNGPEDTGDFALNILDGETANPIPVRVDDPPLEALVAPQQTVVYELQGVEEGDYVSIYVRRPRDVYSPYFRMVSLDGTFSYSLYSKTVGSGQNERELEIYRVQGTGPYRLIAISDEKDKDVEFELEVQSGDQLGQDIGELTFGEETSASIPDDQVYLWTVSGTQGQVINLHVRKDRNQSLEYVVLGPKGAYLNSDYWYGEETELDSGPIELDEDGIYTVALSTYDSQTSVDLSLELLDVPAAVSDTVEAGKAVSAPLVNNREDQWSFSGKAGQLVTVTVFTSDASANVYFSLLGPDGNRILYASSNLGKGQLGPIALPQNGEYVISVSSNTISQGTYEMTLNPTGESTAQPGQTLPAATLSPQGQLRNANILLYEDNGNLAPWVRETLDSMGMQYTKVTPGAMGDLTAQVESGTNWDLIIIVSEGKQAGVQGQVWEPIISQVIDNNSALIAEIWNLDQIAGGKMSRLLDACGIGFQKDLAQVNPIYTLVPDHAVFNEPNGNISLINFVRYWRAQSGDLIRLAPNSNATILAGIKEDRLTDYGVLASCLDGRVILQTFSDHDFHEKEIKALWENYIQYVLTNHFGANP